MGGRTAAPFSATMQPRSAPAAARARALAPALLLLALARRASPALGALVRFDNTAPVLTADGAILDAHDQSLRRFAPGGPYLRHAVAYGGCAEPNGTGCDRTAANCGFQGNHSIDVWASDSLASGSWRKIATAIAPEDRPPGVVFRPAAVFNENTGAVVLMW